MIFKIHICILIPHLFEKPYKGISLRKVVNIISLQVRVCCQFETGIYKDPPS